MRIVISLLVLLNLSQSSLAAIGEQQFQNIIIETQDRLGPWVRAHYGREFLVTGDWQKPYSPTSAGGSFYQLNGKWAVHIVGWVARSPEITEDGMRLIYCHELGHHVNGAGAEVESDYFATSACAPQIFLKDDPGYDSASLSNTDKESCANSFDPPYCERVMTAVNLTNAFRASLWRLHGTMNESEIEKTVSCRKQVFLDGILGSNPTICLK